MMQINPLTLQFPEPLESEFRDHFYKKSLKQGRIAILTVVGLFLLWGIADSFLAPEAVRYQIFIIRYGLVCPFLLGVFFFSFSHYFKPFIQPLWGLMILITCSSLVAISVLSRWSDHNLDSDSLHVALILALIYTYTFVMLRFIYTVGLGCIIIVLYNLVCLLLLKMPLLLLIKNDFFLISANCIGLCASYQIELFLRRIFYQLCELNLEKQNSERLLLNILPQTIAKRLKENQDTIADSFPSATVLFADIVGFTEMSNQVSPVILVNLLNRIFSEFDRLAEEYGLEKIKTIGDSYMVVGGLPIPREDHIESVAQMSLHMLEKIREINQEMKSNFKIRIGINSGPVVAGVIGIKKFIYDLWGDTVNIASRMESHGIPGKIQVTESIYILLKDKFIFQERGLIKVKGKGEMKTYFLLRKNKQKA